MCILSVFTLLKVVGYYDLSVLSMSVIGFKKKYLDGGWVQFFWDFLNFFNFAKPLRPKRRWLDNVRSELREGLLGKEVHARMTLR